MTLHFWAHLEDGVEPVPGAMFFSRGNYIPAEIVFEHTPKTQDLIDVFNATPWMAFLGEDFPQIVEVPNMPEGCKRCELAIRRAGRLVGKVEVAFFHIWSN